MTKRARQSPTVSDPPRTRTVVVPVEGAVFCGINSCGQPAEFLIKQWSPAERRLAHLAYCRSHAQEFAEEHRIVLETRKPPAAAG